MADATMQLVMSTHNPYVINICIVNSWIHLEINGLGLSDWEGLATSLNILDFNNWRTD